MWAATGSACDPDVWTIQCTLFVLGNLKIKQIQTSLLGLVWFFLLAVSVWHETSTHRLQGRVDVDTRNINYEPSGQCSPSFRFSQGVPVYCTFSELFSVLLWHAIPLFVYCVSLQWEVTALCFIFNKVTIIITESDKRRNTKTITQIITAVIRRFTDTNTYNTHLNIYYISSDAGMLFSMIPLTIMSYLVIILP